MGIESARRSCLFFLARLDSDVARLSQIAFPGHHTGPRKWLKYIGGLLETARAYLDTAADPTKTIAEANDLIQKAEILGSQAYEWLTHVAGADATAIPHQVVAPFQRWVKSLGIDNTIFFRAEHLSNYELWTFDARGYVATLLRPSQGLIEANVAIQWPVLRVTVPAQAMGMLPHFAVVAHELGHAIQDSILPDFAPFAAEDAAFEARVSKRLVSCSLVFGTAEALRSQLIATAWINEFKADAVGHGLVGPAFFFALSGFLELSNRGYGIAPTHPPSDLRLNMLVSAIGSGSYSFNDVSKSHSST